MTIDRNLHLTLAPLISVCALALVATLAVGCAGSTAREDLPPEDIIVANARGAAALGQQETEQAVEEFRAAVEARPDDALLRSNLALAEMLRGEFESAEEQLRRALEIDPEFVPARFRLGVILKNRGEVEGAIAEFETVAAADPNDLVTWYHLGSLRSRAGNAEGAIADYEKALALDPTHISTLYGMGRVLIQKGDLEGGTKFLNESQRIREETGIGETVGLQYGEQGKYSLATEYSATGLDALEAIAVAFEAVDGAVPAVSDAAGVASPSDGVLLDANADGIADIALPGAGSDPARVFLGKGDGTFRAAEMPAFGTTGQGTGARRPWLRAADLDGDATLDLIGGSDALDVIGSPWNAGSGTAGSSASERPAGWPVPAGPALPSDVDHDGDIDLIVPLAAGDDDALAILINKGDGSMRTGRTVPSPGGGPWSVLAASDFDNDRDVDIVAATGPDATSARIVLLTNQRDGTYGVVDLADGGAQGWSAIHALAVADVDKDGFMDLVVGVAPSGGSAPVAVLKNVNGRKVEKDAAFAASGQEVGNGRSVAVFDYDNDGFLDVGALVAPDGKSAPSLRIVRNLGRAGWAGATGDVAAGVAVDPGAGFLGAADLDGDGDADLVAGTTVLRNQGGQAHAWASVDPRGVGDNTYGAGLKMEFRAGSLWQKFEVGPSGLPVHIGLGARDRLDGVRMLWPGGVLQDEIEVAASKRQEIVQLDRKGTSCPILYAWNGTSVQFVTDFLGGSAFGYRLGEDAWNTPDTDEYVKIEASQLAERAGVWDLRLVNQLEEVIFFDRAQLVVVDHPAGVEIFPNERLMPGPPFPPFRVIRASNPRAPLAATDETGRDVLALVAENDRVTVDTFDNLPFKGYAEPHDLVLTLGTAAEIDGAGQIVLLLDGWIDYADSTSNLKAAQAGVTLLPPSLDARRPGEEWRAALPSMGFPAGLPKTMTVDLTGLLRPGETEVRIRTSMRIYWDRVRVATAGESAPVTVTRLDPARADLRFLGYPRSYSPDGRAPKIYDYSQIDFTAPWKAHVGAYTRFGDVLPLLTTVDDRYVTTRHGDEIALAFDAGAAPPLPDGWTRSFLFYSDGFGKDMDPNSAWPVAVGPLPFHSMVVDQSGRPQAGDGLAGRAAFLDHWNTRLVTQRR